MIHVLFLQKSLVVFYLGEEQLSSQPSNGIRELEHYFRALCATQLGILKHHTQQHGEQRFSSRFSICAFEEEVYSDFSQQQFSSYWRFHHHFFPLLFLKPGNADPRSSKLNTWLSRIMASGCSFASRAAPGGRRSGRHVKHMPSGWAQLPTVCCCHVGKLSLGASPGENAHRFSALGDTYHNLLLAGQSFLLTCVAHPPQGGTTNLTGFQSWSLCAQRHQRTWVIPITSSITSS